MVALLVISVLLKYFTERERKKAVVFIFLACNFSTSILRLEYAPGCPGTYMCSSGHNLVTEIHLQCPSAFCVAKMKCKVWNVPPLFALMGVTSAAFPQDLTSSSCACRLMKLVRKQSTNVLQGVIFLDRVTI